MPILDFRSLHGAQTMLNTLPHLDLLFIVWQAFQLNMVPNKALDIYLQIPS